MVIWKNKNMEKQKFGKMEIRKNGNFLNANSENCKFGKMQIWKNANLEKSKFGKMQMIKGNRKYKEIWNNNNRE